MKSQSHYYHKVHCAPFALTFLKGCRQPQVVPGTATFSGKNSTEHWAPCAPRSAL